MEKSLYNFIPNPFKIFAIFLVQTRSFSEFRFLKSKKNLTKWEQKNIDIKIDRDVYKNNPNVILIIKC